MIKRLVLISAFALIPQLATASMMGSSYFFEPSVGYRIEQIKLTDKLNTESQFKMNTPTYGLKLGYRSATGIDLNLAGDYSSGKAEHSPINESVNFTHKMVAVQLGINALGSMKMYLGYAFMNELQLEKGAFHSDLNLKGPSYQVGLQLRLLSSLSVGAQYNLNQFDQVKGTAYMAGDKIDSYFNKLDSSDYSFNLSLTF